MDIYRILDDLEREFAEKQGFFSRRIDIDKCAYLVAQLKKEVPIVLQEASQILASKKEILANADNIAKHMIREAESRADRSLIAAEVTHRAELEAQKILGSAYSKCDSIAIHTQSHLDKVFFDAEKYLLETLKTISDNRVKIKERVNPINNDDE